MSSTVQSLARLLVYQLVSPLCNATTRWITERFTHELFTTGQRRGKRNYDFSNFIVSGEWKCLWRSVKCLAQVIRSARWYPVTVAGLCDSCQPWAMQRSCIMSLLVVGPAQTPPCVTSIELQLWLHWYGGKGFSEMHTGYGTLTFVFVRPGALVFITLDNNLSFSLK